MAIQAIVPFIPLITKLFDIGAEAKEKNAKQALIEAAAKSTGKTELAQGGYIYSLVSISHTVLNCNESLSIASLSCVSTDQWVMLSGFLSMAYATLRAKLKG